MMQALDFIRNAGETRRFHTWPVLRQQNVAEHSWHVTMLLWFIFGGDLPGVRLPLIMAALTHDAAEWQVGDVPAPAKRSLQERGFEDFRAQWGKMEQDILAEHGWDWEGGLTAAELSALKLCDSMDGALYCVRERAMGNKLIDICYRNFMSYVEDLLEKDFPIMARHGDRVGPAGDDVPLDDATPESTRVARQVYNHIKDQWEQADV